VADQPNLSSLQPEWKEWRKARMGESTSVRADGLGCRSGKEPPRWPPKAVAAAEHHVHGDTTTDMAGATVARAFAHMHRIQCFGKGLPFLIPFLQPPFSLGVRRYGLSIIFRRACRRVPPVCTIHAKCFALSIKTCSNIKQHEVWSSSSFYLIGLATGA